jgi:hypothetical protein
VGDYLFIGLDRLRGFVITLLSLPDNPANDSHCHSETFGSLRINSAKDLKIVRLTVQKDLVRQPL